MTVAQVALPESSSCSLLYGQSKQEKFDSRRGWNMQPRMKTRQQNEEIDAFDWWDLDHTVHNPSPVSLHQQTSSQCFRQHSSKGDDPSRMARPQPQCS